MSDPFKIDGPTCISFSGGRTSAYMLWRVLQSNGGLPEEARVLFCNTGKEEEATLRFVQDCSERWGVPITWLEYRYVQEWSEAVEQAASEWRWIAGAPEPKRWELTSFEHASRAGEPFEALIRQRIENGDSGLPNVVNRYCSSELKTRTMHKYLRSIGWTEWDTFIGIRADEQRRYVKFHANPHPEGKHETVWTPLVRAGVTKKVVSEFWKSQAFDLGLPNINGITYHGNCDLCMNKHAAVVRSLVAERPERATWWIKQEKYAEGMGRTTGARFSDDRESFQVMQKNAIAQWDFIGHDEEWMLPCLCGDDA